MFNKPDSNQKLVIVTLLGLYGGTAESGHFTPGSFRLLGKNGTFYQPAFVVHENQIPVSTEVVKGGQVQGDIVYKVAANDDDFVVVANMFPGEGLYLATK